MSEPILIGPDAITHREVLAAGRRARGVRLAEDPAWRARIARGAAVVESLAGEGEVAYGISTGFGDSCTVPIPADLSAELALNLSRFHGCGLGAELSPQAARGVLLIRLASLARGWSGVRLALLERLALFLAEDLLPIIPEEGSVGASGDLTPLSYLAAALMGEREVWLGGARMDAAQAHHLLGIAPLALTPREGLAVMNGTAVTTALSCLAVEGGRRLLGQAAVTTALALVAVGGNPGHLDPRLFQARAHWGAGEAAAAIARCLAGASGPWRGDRVQDRYSIRCAPQVLGVLAEALAEATRVIDVEIAGVDDNPLVDPDAGEILHGSNFYAGQVGFAMDGLKAALASAADLMDRQVALLTNPATSGGLPANLSGAQGPRAALSHGLKALSIAASAWAAEALKLTMPAASFSRSTENHNQDKVPMATMAARDALRVLALSEQVWAAALIASAQGVAIRRGRGEVILGEGALRDRVEAVAAQVGPLTADRPLDGPLRALLAQLREGRWEAGP